MRAGQVSSAQNSLRRPTPVRPRKASDSETPESAEDAGSAAGEERHHWHLSDLLHPFHHRKAS